jgi:hypothetical protein
MDRNEVYWQNIKIQKKEEEIKKWEELGKAIDLTKVKLHEIEFPEAMEQKEFKGAQWDFSIEFDEESFEDEKDEVVNAMTELLALGEQFGNDLKMSIQDAIGDVITSIAEMFGELVATGAVEGGLDQLFMVFADFAKKLGSLMIAFGVASLAFSTNLKAAFTNPANAIALIAAGAALVGIGSAIKSLAKAGPGGTSTANINSPYEEFRKDGQGNAILRGDTIQLATVRSISNNRAGNLRYG